jgi:23S rRNA (guanine745-N1)-methyltransferase
VTLQLRCTVRGCSAMLERSDRLVCPNAHAFDRAREGYWNLLQPQDRKSSAAGDHDDATRARRRWLSRGFAEGLTRAMLPFVKELAPDSTAADIGCGEGTLTAQLFDGAGVDVCGVELSAKAAGMAARLRPEFTWLVVNADRGLPFADASLDLAVSIFGRRPATELARVVRPGASFLAVLPGPSDLIELRAAAQGEGVERDRVDSALKELGSEFTLRDRIRWSHRARHDRGALVDALTMSYRGERQRERERLATLDALEVTLEADILALRR